MQEFLHQHYGAQRVEMQVNFEKTVGVRLAIMP